MSRSSSQSSVKEDVHQEVAVLILSYRWEEGELHRIGEKVGMGEKEFRALLATLRDAVLAEGFVLV